jgi:hypothetical protein
MRAARTLLAIASSRRSSLALLGDGARDRPASTPLTAASASRSTLAGA